jgi:hypothetical protein
MMEDMRDELMKDSVSQLMERLDYCGYDSYYRDYREQIVKEIRRRLKEPEAVKPYLDYDGKDVWRCGGCGAAIFHPERTQADDDAKNYARFCRKCGKRVDWK